MAGIDLTESSKVVFLTQTSDPRVVEPQYHYVYSTVSMRMGYPIYWGWIAKNNPQIKNKKICVLATDDITGHNEVDMHTRYMTTFAVNKPEPLYFKRGTADYTPIATKIKELNPYMVACGGVQPGGQFASVLKALNESGWKGFKYNGAGIGLTENLEIAGKEAVEGYLGAITDGSGLKSPPSQLLKLKELYEQSYGSGSWERERVAPSINWISAWYFLVGFLKKTASLDSDVVAKTLQGIEVETPMGLARLITPPQRKDNLRTAEVTTEVRIGEIKDGKMNHIHTVSLDEGMGYISAVFK
jgi:branched-chain amino acid transport system substrate-binding protein